jgi:hypothetical protein
MPGWFDFEAAARHAFGLDGCQLAAIREVDWYKHEDREFSYLIVTYWLVESNGMRAYQERREEFPPDHEGPDYTYLCTACDQRFWFWSDVILHVKDVSQ